MSGFLDRPIEILSASLIEINRAHKPFVREILPRKDSLPPARTPSAMSVSSEVRRTLVKSPPELWAELSDPLALSRHLDELGEIRITGTIPERIVDWEAASAHGADTIGRIEIEPSGWGTRVTLSASRQTPSPRSDAETTLAPAAGAVSNPTVGAVSPPAAATVSQPAAQQQPEPSETAFEAAPGEPAPEPERRDAPETPASQPEHERISSRPPPEASSQPAPEAVPAPALAATSEPAPASQPETAPESSLVLDPDIVASEPLKTFWARLFRRRRARPQPERSMELQAPAEAENHVQPEAETTVQPKPEITVQPKAEITVQPKADATAGEPAPASEEPAAPEPQPALAPPAPATVEPQSAPAPNLGAEEPQSVPAPDLGAELAELEQQTTAVLTGVLDRLGAAHHRPFSRA